MRVLIVEDSQVVADRLIELLQELPGPIEVVGCAQDAVEGRVAVRDLRPDVVILDLNLPRGSGFDVLDEVGVSGEPARVVVLTNHATEEYRRRCLTAGAAFFLDKSLEFERVRDALESWLPPRTRTA